MCGRYSLKTSPEDLERQLRLEGPVGLAPRYNIAPLQAAPIVTQAAPHRLTVARWGLLPRWAKDAGLASKLINARAETLATKPAFRDALLHHRCLVPCDGFYEWTHHGATRTPHYLHPREPRVLTLAGLSSTWTSPEGLEVQTFTIVTTMANDAVRGLHDRMPVILDDEARDRWLAEGAADMTSLLVPWRGALTSYQVEPYVNQVGVDDARCLEPARVVQLSLL